VEASIAKLYSSEMLGRVVDAAVQIHGGYGVSKEFPLERWYREARVRRIGEGPAGVHRMGIARALFRAWGRRVVSPEILCEVEGGIATVTLNRPEKRNAMSLALLRELRARFDDLDGRSDVRVVVVRGAGPAFCSGMDLREMGERRDAADPEVGVTEILQRVEHSRHPTIAMAHGDAIAGGCELALHCDLRIAAEPARLGMPLARIGLLVPFPLLQKLVEIIGSAATRELLFTGKPVDARRALEMGMVHQVVPPAE